MPSNIEIKARVRNWNEIRQRAERLSDTPVQIIHQEDIFFNTEKGRLKLRVLAPDRGQLIYYMRSDQEGPKRSDYHIYETPDPENLKRVLELAYGIRGVVKKTRYLYLVGRTRIHLDDVDGLGQFMELEVVLKDGQSIVEGEEIAERLMNSLGVERSNLIDGAYMDLIASNESANLY
ncbi:MAG TPA: class IV adenylate cyclase [Anaerolineales bacterium]|nr:class IV adenylate cyclase [Anaerolineales bacterium]